jgi:hypothetical protein
VASWFVVEITSEHVPDALPQAPSSEPIIAAPLIAEQVTFEVPATVEIRPASGALGLLEDDAALLLA